MSRLYDRLQTRRIGLGLPEEHRGWLDWTRARILDGGASDNELLWAAQNFPDAAEAERLEQIVEFHAEQHGPRPVRSKDHPVAEQVIAADEVAHFLAEVADGTTKVTDIVSTIAPPFSEPFFIEFDRLDAKRFGVTAAGVLVTPTSPGDDGVLDSARWGMKLDTFVELHGDLASSGEAVVSVDVEGSLMTNGDRWFDHFVRYFFDAPLDDPDWRHDLFDVDADYSPDTNIRRQWVYAAALLTISFMHCKNVDVATVDPPPAVNKRHIKKYGRALCRYHVLDIAPMRRVLRRDGHADQSGLRHALHICRGHFKTFTPDAPLFGKLTGTYWWADQVRGSADEGVVEKEYRVTIEDGTLGRTYEPADEHPELATAPENRGSDPDHAGRGLGAHNRTQNLLAAAVERAGHKPRRPRPEEPQYDLAWETPDAAWVAEVKSLTAKNELRQMHTAIGQVIDYGHRLDAGDRPVRLLIAVECEPLKSHWIEECVKREIALAWPDTFAALVGQPSS